MIEFISNTELALIGVAFVAGIIDAIAGGGGLITLPALLIAGVPPLSAIATNKLQGAFGTLVATSMFVRSGHLKLQQEWLTALLCCLGAGFGAWLAALIPSDLLATIMPYVLLAIASFFLFKKDMSDVERKPTLNLKYVKLLFIPLIAIFDGFFGPGTGSLYMIMLIAFSGYGILQSTGRVKLYNFSSNLGALISFIFIGAIWWKLGFLMAIGQVTGSIIGSRIAIIGGIRVIKPLLVVVCVAMAIKLLLG